MSGRVHGQVDRAFRAVREVFEADFANGQNVGAAVAVFVDGRAVVDLWGGAADARTGRPWVHDTPAITFSCTKAVTATAALAVAHETGVDWEAPVTNWWPEYGAAGKGATVLADLLTHSAGLPVLEQPATVEQAADPAAMAALLARQRPLWQPGTEHGYHALTFGWLVGEFVRRRTDSTVGEFVRRRFGDDLWIGAPPEVIARAARVGFPPAAERAWTDSTATDAAVLRLAQAYQDPDSLLMRGSTNPMASANKPEVLAGGWPASGLVTTARGLARFYRDLVAGTLLPPSILREAVREQVRGPDAVLVQESAFGLGYMLPAQNFVLPAAARPTAFGHPGAGGALGLGDLTHRVAIAFVPNLRRDWLSGDRRAYDLVRAVYDAL
ncbi:serine hydrolase domain-containing protein [Nocardia stercoris]|uniref:Class A beta-lactamase-related serine hydrolase n=1 Tax=Nocardia stercoris TaxID=2483361 RepID=A0A3M2KYV6_9NOCA|nr:serine hydrolase domain-containing protein [Nocardia stercoris]RMI29453.1 class A beta-lactamase-related serine hydrolase [Nocardia stercoris]